MPWKPGQSGNPNGRPPGSHRPLTQTIQRLLVFDPETGEPDPEKCRAVRLAEELWEVALDRDHPGWAKAVQTIFDRVEGRPTQRTEVTGQLVTLNLHAMSKDELVEFITQRLDSQPQLEPPDDDNP